MNPASPHYIAVFLLFFLSSFCLQAQSFERITPPVEREGIMFRYPWAGGLNAPQVVPVDLNHDVQKDLLLYDRIGGVVIPMINESEAGEMNYRYDPSYREGLPPLTGWVTVRDFNRDGLPDYFTSAQQISGVFGAALYQAMETENGIEYRLRTFDQKQYLVVPAGNGTTNIYISWEDIPAIEDVDRDGDLDVLAFEPGGSFITYYRNLVVEQGLDPDTMVFEVGDHCWGKVLESEVSEELFLSDDSLSCSDGNLVGDPVINTRHSGSTIMLFDQDGDADFDILIGDIASPTLVFGLNGGSVNNAWITEQDPQWPSYDTPLENPYFNAAFRADVDNDGFEDILGAINSRSFAEDRDVIWYYQHTGNQDEARFELTRRDLFTGDMLEFGSETNPAFCDVNADGLADLIIGAFKSDEATQARIPSLHLLINRGVADAPQFEYVDDDYLGLSAYSTIPTWAYAPAVGDLDGDGDDDLVVGEFNGQLFFFENEAGVGAPYAFKDEVFPFEGIDVGSAAAPAVFDINQDGLGDLVLGERNTNFGSTGNCGALNYFQNTGTVGAASFDPDETAFPNTHCFGNVVLGTIPGLPVFSKPVMIETGAGPYLLLGADEGGIQVYRDIREETYGSFTLVDADYGRVREGFKTSVAATDLDGNGFYDLVIGNRRGGVTAFRTDLEAISTSTDQLAGETVGITPFPNPANAMLGFSTTDAVQIFTISLKNMQGVTVVEKAVLHQGALDVSSVPAGLYLAIIETNAGTVVEKVVVQR